MAHEIDEDEAQKRELDFRNGTPVEARSDDEDDDADQDDG